MNEPQADPITPPSKTTGNTISLTIDYSNGAQKSFNNIPCQQSVTVLDVLAQMQSAKPGLQYEFSPEFTDRAGREVGRIISIDGVTAESDQQHWLVWINQNYCGHELRGDGINAGTPRVKAGDVITLKLSSGL